jgi:hypothetical protein
MVVDPQHSRASSSARAKTFDHIFASMPTNKSFASGACPSHRCAGQSPQFAAPAT